MALSANALTTVATARDALGLADTAATTTLLEQLIAAASELIATRCARVMQFAAGIAERTAGYGGPYLVARRAPVKAVTSVTHDGATIDLTDLVIHADMGVLELPRNWPSDTWIAHSISRTPLPGVNNSAIVITYDGGWVTPGQAGTRDLPHDIEEACIDLVASMQRRRGADKTIRSESLMNYSVTYGLERTRGNPADAALPASVVEAIARYSRPVFA